MTDIPSRYSPIAAFRSLPSSSRSSVRSVSCPAATIAEKLAGAIGKTPQTSSCSPADIARLTAFAYSAIAAHLAFLTTTPAFFAVISFILSMIGCALSPTPRRSKNRILISSISPCHSSDAASATSSAASVAASATSSTASVAASATSSAASGAGAGAAAPASQAVTAAMSITVDNKIAKSLFFIVYPLLLKHVCLYYLSFLNIRKDYM